MEQESKAQQNCFAGIGVISSTAILLVLVSLIDGWIFVRLWRWFILPTFQLPALTIWPAVGICIVVRYLTRGRGPVDKDEPVWKTIVNSVAYSVMVFLLGALIHWLAR